MSDESVVEHLARVSDASSPDELARLLVAHRFPLALAERPLASLSPGEPVRAALLCLCQRRPAVELLVLDEPSYARDFVGSSALCAALKAWPGGQIVLEPQTYEHVHGGGESTCSWTTAPRGLFSSRPHLVLQEGSWDEVAQTRTERFFVIDAETGVAAQYLRPQNSDSRE